MRVAQKDKVTLVCPICATTFSYTARWFGSAKKVAQTKLMLHLRIMHQHVGSN